MPAELHVIGTRALLSILPVSKLTNAQAIMAALKSKPLRSGDELVDCLYGDDPDGGPEYARNCVSIGIWLLRQRGIKIVTRYGRGYELATTENVAVR